MLCVRVHCTVFYGVLYTVVYTNVNLILHLLLTYKFYLHLLLTNAGINWHTRVVNTMQFVRNNLGNSRLCWIFDLKFYCTLALILNSWWIKCTSTVNSVDSCLCWAAASAGESRSRRQWTMEWGALSLCMFKPALCALSRVDEVDLREIAWSHQNDPMPSPTRSSQELSCTRNSQLARAFRLPARPPATAHCTQPAHSPPTIRALELSSFSSSPTIDSAARSQLINRKLLSLLGEPRVSKF